MSKEYNEVQVFSNVEAAIQNYMKYMAKNVMLPTNKAIDHVGVYNDYVQYIQLGRIARFGWQNLSLGTKDNLASFAWLYGVLINENSFDEDDRAGFEREGSDLIKWIRSETAQKITV